MARNQARLSVPPASKSGARSEYQDQASCQISAPRSTSLIEVVTRMTSTLEALTQTKLGMENNPQLQQIHTATLDESLFLFIHPRSGRDSTTNLFSPSLKKFAVHLSWFCVLQKHSSDHRVPTQVKQFTCSLGTTKKRTPSCLIFYVVPRAGLEPARHYMTENFKSSAATITPPGQCDTF